jgi:hypothetical protein
VVDAAQAVSGRRVAWSAAVALALVGLVVVVEVVMPRVRARRAEARDRLLAAGATLDELTLSRAGEKLVFRRDPRGAFLIADGERQLVANAPAMQAIFETLRDGRMSGLGVESSPLVAYGLDPPRVTLGFTDSRGERSLALGAPTLDGRFANALSQGERLVLVPIALLAATDQDLDHFRLKSVIKLDPTTLLRVDIQRRADQVPPGAAQHVVMERATAPDEHLDTVPWRMVEPIAFEANTRRLESLLSRLASLQALDFGADAPEPADLAETGLDKPAVLLVLTGSSGTTRLAFGFPVGDDRAWARVGDGGLVTVKSDVVHEMLLPEEFWRDARIVKLPPLRLVNVRIDKGDNFKFEMARDDPRGAWRLVQPGDAELVATDAQSLITALDAIQCGRFEDALAKDPDRAELRWDFVGPGSIRMSVLAILSDGSPRNVDIDMAIFMRERVPYFAVRMIDGEGRMDTCVILPKSMDEVLDQARALMRAAPAPP